MDYNLKKCSTIYPDADSDQVFFIHNIILVYIWLYKCSASNFINRLKLYINVSAFKLHKTLTSGKTQQLRV